MKQAKRDNLIQLMEKYLDVLGIPHNEETDETARRVVDLHLNEMTFVSGEEPEFKVTVFKNHKPYDQLVIQKNIAFRSWCSHHLLPYFGKIHLGYLPGEFLVGLSKMPRMIDWMSSQPTSQEHLVEQIADFFVARVKPEAFFLSACATHTCVSCRGVRAAEAQTITNVVRHSAKIDKSRVFGALKSEFFNQISMMEKA